MARRTTKSRTPATGRGAPAWRATAITLPKDPFPGSRTEGQKIVLSTGADAQGKAKAVADEVVSAIKRSDIRRLAFLTHEFPEIVLRLPGFNDFMDHLYATRQDQAVSRIMGERAGRGRPPEEPKNYFYLIGVVDRVCEREGVSVARAAELVRERWCQHRYIGSLSARTIENIHSQYKHLFDLFQSGRYLPPDSLTDDAFKLPNK